MHRAWRRRVNQPKRGEMNRNEAAYANHLNGLLRAGKIIDWVFEPPKLRLAYRCFYTPDFRVVHGDKSVAYHEVKGRKGDGFYAREDAMLKLKFAADKYREVPFVVVWPLRGGGWGQRQIPVADE